MPPAAGRSRPQRSSDLLLLLLLNSTSKPADRPCCPTPVSPVRRLSVSCASSDEYLCDAGAGNLPTCDTGIGEYVDNSTMTCIQCPSGYYPSTSNQWTADCEPW